MQSFLLTVTYKTKEGKAKDFVRAVKEAGILGAIRGEDGCKMYDYYFSAECPDTVLLLEEWESEEHQKVHMSAPHIPALLKLVEEFVENTEFRKLN